MLLFAADVAIGYLDCRMADVLAFASIWSIQRHEDVRVRSIHDSLGRRLPITGSQFESSVELAVEPSDAGAREQLAVYLAETLGRRFSVRNVDELVRVEWYMHYAGLERGEWA